MAPRYLYPDHHLDPFLWVSSLRSVYGQKKCTQNKYFFDGDVQAIFIRFYEKHKKYEEWFGLKAQKRGRI